MIPKKTANVPNLKKSIAKYKRESKLNQPIYKTENTDFKKFEKVTYKFSDDDNKKKKSKTKQTVLIVVVLAIVVGAIVVLAYNSDLPSCDEVSCDPAFDDDCYCE